MLDAFDRPELASELGAFTEEMSSSTFIETVLLLPSRQTARNWPDV
jgi:hypothetical protein